NSQLLLHAGRWGDSGGAVFQAETSRNVCRHFGSRRASASAPQSTTTRCRVDRKAPGGQRHDRGTNLVCLSLILHLVWDKRVQIPLLQKYYLSFNGVDRVSIDTTLLL